MSRLDSGTMGVAVFAAVMSLGNLAVIGIVANHLPPPCKCKPAPTPAACCKADDCRKELAQVDARFGGVWDELVEVQEQLAKVKPCGCSDKPACECQPDAKPAPKPVAAPACGRRGRR